MADKLKQDLEIKKHLETLHDGQLGQSQMFFQRKLIRTDGRKTILTEKPILFIFHTVPIRNENEETVLFLFNFRDITYTLKKKKSIESDIVSEHRLSTSAVINAMKRKTVLQQAKDLKNKVIPKSIIHQMNTDKSFTGESLMSRKIDKKFAKSSMVNYKQKNKHPHWIIFHYSTFKIVWGWWILLLTLYTAISVPFVVCFNQPRKDTVWGTGMLVIDSFVDIIFIADVAINFVTTIVGTGGEVVTDPLIIRMNYISTWFTLDLLSCFPYDLMHAIVQGELSEEGITTLFSALKVARLLRLGRVARKLDHYAEYSGVMLILLVGLFSISGHWLACIWYKVGYGGMKNTTSMNPMEHSLVDYNWLVRLGKEMGQEYFLDNSTRRNVQGGPHITDCYISSFYFTLSSLTSVGFGNISPNTKEEKLVSVLMLMFGALLYASIFGNVTTIITQMYADTNRYHDMLSSVREFLRIYQIPQGLRARIMHYIISTWNMTKGIDTTRVLNYFPKDMRADICVHLNRKVFNEHSAFQIASDSCLRGLALEFCTMHYAPGDIIYHKGENLDELSFVVTGSLEVLQDDELVAM